MGKSAIYLNPGEEHGLSIIYFVEPKRNVLVKLRREGWNMFKFLEKLFGKKKEKVSRKNVLSHEEVIRKLCGVWPNLNTGCLQIADAYYVLPTRNELEKLLFDSSITSKQYKKEVRDCDDFALLLHADVILSRYCEELPWAFGQIWYQDKKIGGHAINLCITYDNGMLLIEPQNVKIRYPCENMNIQHIRI